MLFRIIFHYSPYEKFSVCLQRRWSSWAIHNSFAYITQGYYPASQNIPPHHSNRLTLPQPLKGIMTDELFQNNVICVFMCALSKTCKLFASHWFGLCGVKGFRRLCFKSLDGVVSVLSLAHAYAFFLVWIILTNLFAFSWYDSLLSIWQIQKIYTWCFRSKRMVSQHLSGKLFILLTNAWVKSILSEQIH